MININNITKTYNTGKANETSPVKDFSAVINKGELVILSGPSGSGKSTVLNIIAGILKPTHGAVDIDGRIISKLPEHFAAKFRMDHIGMIFQQFHLIDNMTVTDNVSLPLLPSSLNHQKVIKRVKYLLDKLCITDKAELKAGQLSGGEMQRAAIARALINTPEIILADEPTANLDKKLTYEFIDIIRELKKEGKTIVIATHDSAIIESGIATKVIEMTKEL